MAKWTDEEIEVLKMDISVEEMQIFLPKRERNSIIRKKKSLGFGEKETRIWTEDEIKILKMDITVKEMQKLLKNRTICSINGKKKGLGIIKKQAKHKIWTDEDLAILNDEYPFEPKEIVAKKLGRSWSAIVNKARTLKIRRYR